MRNSYGYLTQINVFTGVAFIGVFEGHVASITQYLAKRGTL
jgi:hypothetical protein